MFTSVSIPTLIHTLQGPNQTSWTNQPYTRFVCGTQIDDVYFYAC